jgi:hypothetical protein
MVFKDAIPLLLAQKNRKTPSIQVQVEAYIYLQLISMLHEKFLLTGDTNLDSSCLGTAVKRLVSEVTPFNERTEIAANIDFTDTRNEASARKIIKKIYTTAIFKGDDAILALIPKLKKDIFSMAAPVAHLTANDSLEKLKICYQNMKCSIAGLPTTPLIENFDAYQIARAQEELKKMLMDSRVYYLLITQLVQQNTVGPQDDLTPYCFADPVKNLIDYCMSVPLNIKATDIVPNILDFGWGTYRDLSQAALEPIMYTAKQNKDDNLLKAAQSVYDSLLVNRPVVICTSQRSSGSTSDPLTLLRKATYNLHLANERAAQREADRLALQEAAAEAAKAAENAENEAQSRDFKKHFNIM